MVVVQERPGCDTNRPVLEIWNKHQLTTHQSLRDSPILFRGEWIILPNPNTLSAPWLPRTIVLCHTPHTVQITSTEVTIPGQAVAYREWGCVSAHIFTRCSHVTQCNHTNGLLFEALFIQSHPVFLRIPPAELCDTHNMTDLSLLSSSFSFSYCFTNLEKAVSSCSWQAPTPAANFLMLLKIHQQHLTCKTLKERKESAVTLWARRYVASRFFFSPKNVLNTICKFILGALMNIGMQMVQYLTTSKCLWLF